MNIKNGLPPQKQPRLSPILLTLGRIWGQLEDTFAKSRDYKPSSKEWLTSSWNGFASPKDLATEVLPHLPTSVDHSLLLEIGKTISTYPTDLEVHSNLKRIIANRGKSVTEDTGVDMSTAEALAFGTLVKEGYHVRVSGQDVERGTFSQRHAVLHDQKTEKTYVPLMHVEGEKAGSFIICNSSLSEYGVLGFEYGYSLSSPEALVMCEMQFGDFANVPSPRKKKKNTIPSFCFWFWVRVLMSRTRNALLTSFWRRESQSGNNDPVL
jgi:2-oxoglutarate dehydrogenase E1 component